MNVSQAETSLTLEPGKQGLDRSRRRRIWFGLLIATGLVCAALPGDVMAQGFPKISLQLEDAKDGGDAAVSLQIIFLLTILSLAPSILIMMTSFTRIVVVLSFLRTAIGTHGQTPPNQLIVGLALFLTFFVMAPVWERVNTEAIQPLIADEIQYISDLIPLTGIIEMSFEPVDQPRALHDLAHQHHSRVCRQTIRTRFDTHRAIEARADIRLLLGNLSCFSFTHWVSSLVSCEGRSPVCVSPPKLHSRGTQVQLFLTARR